MNIEKKSRKVLSSDLRHYLAGMMYIPEGEIKGIFQIAHGMREHIGCYDAFMREIAEEGYLVFGYDHLGHGHTVDNPSEFGYFSSHDGWRHLVNDVTVFAEDVREEYGRDIPYVLMGFSMGSFIVRLNAAEFNHQDKLIVMGTGGYNPQCGLGIALIRTVKGIRGEHYVSPVIQTRVFGSYNERFPEDGELGWLSSMEESRREYENDPLCSFEFTMSAMEDLLTLSDECNKRWWYTEIDKTKPILLLSGADDPLGNYGSAIHDVCNRLQESGAQAEMKLYEGCRHVILKDKLSGEVIRDIKQFLKK